MPPDRVLVPLHIQQTSCNLTFKQLLKTHLFATAY
jgi:hypothetical protein